MSFKLGHVSIPKRRILLPLFLFCEYDSSVLQNFKIFTVWYSLFFGRFWNLLDSVIFFVFHFTILAQKASVAFYISQIFSYSARNTKHYIYLCSVVQHTFCFCLKNNHIASNYTNETSLVLVVYLFVWWCLTPLSAIFQSYRGSWRSVLLMEDPEKTTDLSQVTDKLYNIILYTSPWFRFELTTSVVIGTDCIGILVWQ